MKLNFDAVTAVFYAAREAYNLKSITRFQVEQLIGRYLLEINKEQNIGKPPEGYKGHLCNYEGFGALADICPACEVQAFEDDNRIFDGER